MKSWLQNIPDGWLEEGVGGAATEEGDPHHQLDGPGQLLNYDAAGSEEDTSIKEELADQDPLRLEQNEAGFLSVKGKYIKIVLFMHNHDNAMIFRGLGQSFKCFKFL